jgi:hypothetical protein
MDDRKIIVLLAAAAVMGGCGVLGQSGPQPDQVERKERSEVIQRELGVPVDLDLAYLPAERDVQLRLEEEVESRALCLLMLGIKAEDMPPQVLTAMIKRYDLEDALTPYEKSFLEADEVSSQEYASATWRYESANALLWSLGLIDELGPPSEITNVAGMVRILSSMTADEFSDKAVLRSKQEILDAADLAYRLHAASHKANEEGRMIPAGIRESVVFEREYALRWLIRYKELAWGEMIVDGPEEEI